MLLANFRRRLQQRRNDCADAILVMSIIFVPFMFICTGFAMDLTKAVYVKEQYQVMGQEATSAAARNIDEKGSITPAAPQQVVTVYQDRFNGYSSNSANSGNTSNYSTQEGSVGVRNSSCTKITLPNGTTKQAPYMTITLAGGRNDVDAVNGANAPTYVSEGYSAPTLVSGSYDYSKRYYSIAATIYDTAPNLILGMFGFPCQQNMTQVSSITFGSQENVYNFS